MTHAKAAIIKLHKGNIRNAAGKIEVRAIIPVFDPRPDVVYRMFAKNDEALIKLPVRDNRAPDMIWASTGHPMFEGPDARKAAAALAPMKEAA